jgi:hypothetical protein
MFFARVTMSITNLRFGDCPGSYSCDVEQQWKYWWEL